MGGKTESEVKTIIKNELSLEISNKTQNISSISKTAITDITQNIKQSAEASISTNTSLANTSQISGMKISGPNTKVDITQDAKAKAVYEAVIRIISDATALQQMGNQVADTIVNKVQSDQAAKQDLESLSKIGEFSKKSGGPEGMVDAIAKMVGDMTKSVTGGSSSEKSTTEITNSIKTKLNNETINQNTINNTIKSSVSSQMEQMAKAKCDLSTDGKNVIDWKDVGVTDGANFKYIQSLNIESLNKCLIDLNLGAKIASDLTNGFKTESTSQTETKQTSTQDAKAETDVTKQVIQESAIMNTIDGIVSTVGGLMGSWIFIVGGIILLVVLVVGYLFASGAISMDDFAKFTPAGAAAGLAGDILGSDDEQDGGGMNSKIYLLAGLVALLILIARKSIPLCGVLIVVIILYFTHKKNPDLFGLPNKL